jgi:hypothetical protein
MTDETLYATLTMLSASFLGAPVQPFTELLVKKSEPLVLRSIHSAAELAGNRLQLLDSTSDNNFINLYSTNQRPTVYSKVYMSHTPSTLYDGRA